MIDLPDFHDGFLDGVWVSERKSVHLFLRTIRGERLTIVLSDVDRLSVSSFFQGNIILDAVLVNPSKLEIAHIEQLYWPHGEKAPEELVQHALRTAQEKGLWALEINPSYGAECTALFKWIELLSGHVFS